MGADDLYACAEAAVGEAAYRLAEYHRSREDDRHQHLSLALTALDTTVDAVNSLVRRELL